MNKKLLILLCLSIFAPASPLSPGMCRAENGFFIPRVAFSRLVIAPGSWCRYLVTEESMGGRDSSTLYIAIPAGGEAAPKGHFWFEMKGEPVGEAEGEPVIVRLLVSEELRRCARGDSLGDYLSSIYIKEGEEPVRMGDLGALPQLEAEGGRTDSSWISRGTERLDTGAGAMLCERFEQILNHEKKIPAKGATLIKKTRDAQTAWFCEDVPLFQMVRYSADRLRETRMDPPIAGVPVSGARALRTRVELIGYGTGARTLMPLPVSGGRRNGG
ncbi:MAG: hypothetical protein HY770_01750 [Chitinivibrionia bacterium]|nr:hypothetical protein [Chitinivibrionia bacterium]